MEQSNVIKERRGGKRKNAGRKPIKFERVVRKYTAEAILEEINEVKMWKDLLKSGSERTKLTALMYLTDRRDGKARQPVTGPDGGAIQHEHFDLSKLGTDQLSELERLVESATCSTEDGSQG